MVTTRADRIELQDGSVVLGKIVSADGGKFKVETAFAGTIEIAQAKIRSFASDEALFVGLPGGTALQGKVEAAGDAIKVLATEGQMAVSPTKVAAVWRLGQDSPEARKLKADAAALERKWKYEAGVDITGRTGPQEKFGGALDFKATLASKHDKLLFYTHGERAKENGRDVANSQKGGVDYSAFFADRSVWYVRSEIEKDDIKHLDLRSTSAFGLGRKLIKQENQDLEFRLGASYLYETYSNNSRFDSPGVDVAFLHNYTFAKLAKMTNSVVYTPAFKNFNNYRLRHESAIELPIGASMWKLRLGVANEYLSKPPPKTERLDTTYFTRLILNWE
jgi:hypothetical protein